MDAHSIRKAGAKGRGLEAKGGNALDLVGFIEFLFIMAMVLVGPFIWIRLRGEKYVDPEDLLMERVSDGLSSPDYRAAYITREELIHPDFQYYKEYLEKRSEEKKRIKAKERQ